MLVDDELRSVVDEVVDSGWWSMGPKVEEFESSFAEFTGTKHALAVANGTAALHLALLAAGCGPGDEVILPSLNFVAAANAIGHTGATPVFCDIVGADDLNLDPADLEAAVTPATKAVLVLHYGGFPCDIGAVRALVEDRGLIVIEDAAHAPGASWHGEPCGSLGRVGCFSFFSNKNLPVGEGGMIVTDDDDLAASLRLLRSHGMTTLTWERHRGHAASYDVVARGFNYRLDEMRAAMGLRQLRRLPDENAQRRAIAAGYRERLAGVADISMPFAAAGAGTTSAQHLAVALVPAERRDDIRAGLSERRIQTSVHYPPIHLFSYYRELGSRRPLPRTEAVASRLITLPLYGHMTNEQVDLVAGALGEALGAGPG
ncbi:MAG TPA: DegT/DnrJ/EryC1/StrS family aminotransferase [Gaiellaceae bacterium]|nr:DegT/DnrJ/EryC1/StrS family aminotransferase [Gaiellaceae bacterium]